MKYRISYIQSQQKRQAEIEAASPTEAVVKFQHINSAATALKTSSAEITSVLAADYQESW